MQKEKNVIGHKNDFARSYLFTKLLVFRLAKYSIMVITYFVMLFLIKDTTKPVDDIGWYSLGWNWALLVLFGWSAWNISKLVLDSVNKSRLSVIYVSALLIYGIIILTDGKNREITDVRQYINILYYAIFPLCIPIAKHGISSYLNRRVSPLISRNELHKMLGSALLTTSIIMGYLLIYMAFIDESHTFKYDGPYERVMFTALPFTTFGGISLFIIAYIKNYRLHFSGWNKDKVKIVFIPIFLAISSWFFKETFISLHGGPIIIYTTVVGVVSSLMLVYSLVIKGEMASSNVATTIYGTALLVVWILPFLYVSLYGYTYNMYTLINISSIGTSVIIVAISISDNSFTRAQSYAFAGVMLILAATLFGYWFIQSFNFDPEALPFDLDTVLLITFALVPTGFLQTGMWKIFIRQNSLSYWVNIEKKVKSEQLKQKGVTNA